MDSAGLILALGGLILSTLALVYANRNQGKAINQTERVIEETVSQNTFQRLQGEINDLRQQIRDERNEKRRSDDAREQEMRIVRAQLEECGRDKQNMLTRMWEIQGENQSLHRQIDRDNREP